MCVWWDARGNFSLFFFHKCLNDGYQSTQHYQIKKKTSNIVEDFLMDWCCEMAEPSEFYLSCYLLSITDPDIRCRFTLSRVLYFMAYPMYGKDTLET